MHGTRILSLQGIGGVLHRQGTISNPKTMKMVNVEHANRLVIMASGSDRNDAGAQAISSVLAVKEKLSNLKGHIVVQVPNRDTAGSTQFNRVS